MDILMIIVEKVKALPKELIPDGIMSIISHIETAEKHLLRGKLEKDTYLFTDVIYRTNHAFEGILKEAYKILENKNPEKLTPFEIEEYLSKNKVFKERVMELFTNYRASWRNPSTHDYNLFFTEQEAFLAIISVSAFVSILIDQIVEKLTFDIEKHKLLNKVKDIRDAIIDFDKLKPVEKLVSILQQYSREIQSNIKKFEATSGAELTGSITAYLSAVEPNFHITIEPSISIGSTTVRPDLILELDKIKIILEIKRLRIYPDLEFRDHDVAISQLEALMQASNIKYGILYYLPIKQDDQIVVSQISKPNIKNVHPMSKKMYEDLENDAQRYSDKLDQE
jgi:hypothetical protein